VYEMCICGGAGGVDMGLTVFKGTVV